MPQVAFQLWIEDITAHLIGVQMDFHPPITSASSELEPIILKLPAWIPGSYMIRNFARHLAALSARDARGALTLTPLDKHSWQLEHRGLPVTVRYQLYAFDLSVRACYVNDQIAVLNPAACCLSVQGMTDVHHKISLLPVNGHPTWQLATSLKPLDKTEFLGFGDYIAQDYAQLIDSPIMMGILDYRAFEISGVRHHLIFAGALFADLDRIERDLQLICQQQIAVFNGLPADLTEYWFLNWIVDQGYGGLEHKQSTLLLCNRYDLPNPQLPKELTEDYQNYLALCSHEYFHTWWVKRAKPVHFFNYQLDREQYSGQLWLYEGFTSYYDDLALLRSGLITLPQYLNSLSKTISRVSRAPSNHRQSLVESSFTAWTKFYQQDENAINSVVSYYGKGSLVALCLDAQLRKTGLSLDGLMLHCFSLFSVEGSSEQAFFEQLLHYSQNPSLVEECHAWVNGTGPLPLDTSLKILGITLSWRAAESTKDLAGAAQALQTVRDFGALYQASGEGLHISAVPIGSAAYQAGLMVGDVVIAIGNVKATEQNFQQLLQRLPLGETLPLHFFRQQRLLSTDFRLQAAPELIAYLQPAEDCQLQPFWLKPVC